MSKKKRSADLFWQYVRDYLTVNLLKIRGLSPRTVDSYRESLSMYCTFLKEKRAVAFSQASFELLTRESVTDFLTWLRTEKNCCVSTCNLRLSALKSFLKYCGETNIELYAVYQRVKGVPLTKTAKIPVGHMTNAAFKALLAQPNIRTGKGRRNRMIIMLMYDTGTRVQELVDLKLADLHLDEHDPFITVTGKGYKIRSIPLMDKTAAHLKAYLRRFHCEKGSRTGRPLFYSPRDGRPHALSTDAVAIMLKSYGKAARKECSEVPERVHPHLIRHTRATHLYRAGMPLSYIAEFLGHASVTTTTIYATPSIEMMRGALAKADPQAAAETALWRQEESLKKLCGF
jgi:site-specific recombinase XerD